MDWCNLTLRRRIRWESIVFPRLVQDICLLAKNSKDWDALPDEDGVVYKEDPYYRAFLWVGSGDSTFRLTGANPFKVPYTTERARLDTCAHGEVCLALLLRAAFYLGTGRDITSSLRWEHWQAAVQLYQRTFPGDQIPDMPGIPDSPINQKCDWKERERRFRLKSKAPATTRLTRVNSTTPGPRIWTAVTQPSSEDIFTGWKSNSLPPYLACWYL